MTEETTAPTVQQEPMTPDTSIEQADTANTENTDDSAPSDSGNDTTDASPKKKGGFQKRIEQLTREKYLEAERSRQAEERAAALEARMRELEQGQRDKESGVPTEMPVVENYTTLEDFYRDIAKYVEAQKSQVATKAEQEAIKRFEEQFKQAEEARKTEALRQEVIKRDEIARAKYKDYDEVVDPIGPILQRIPHVWEFITQEEMGVEVAYYLGSNPQKISELRSMAPAQAVRELIKMEQRIKAPPPPKTITKAPEPIQPLTGSTTDTKSSLADLAAKDDITAFVNASRKLRR